MDSRVSRLAYERRATPLQIDLEIYKAIFKRSSRRRPSHTQPTIRKREDGMKEGISASMDFTSNLNTDRFEGT